MGKENVDLPLRKINGVDIPVYMENAFSLRSLTIAPQSVSIEQIVGKDSFSVADTGIKYHKLNHLAKDGLLDLGTETGEGGWRKFLLRELVYLRTIEELRAFGVPNNGLHGLCRLFCRNITTIDEVILACINGMEMTLLFYSDGTGFVVSPSRLFRAEEEGGDEVKRTLIRLNLNRAVNDVLIHVGTSSVEVLHSMGHMLQMMKLSEKEQVIMDALRNQDFKYLTISRNTSGELTTLRVERAFKQSLSDEEVINYILSKDYADISIKRRDSSIVAATSTDVIKL